MQNVCSFAANLVPLSNFVMNSNFSSLLVENAVNELSRLPGIGKKTALRLALHILKLPVQNAESLGNAIIKMRHEIQFCSECNNVSDTPICAICSNPLRTHSLLCVVVDIRDVMAIENTGQFKGLYHVLGGLISPMEGIGPNDLSISSLVDRIRQGAFQEIIFALPSTVEGDTTNFYIFKQLQSYPVLFSSIARGIPIGDDLEYTDEVTLGRSISLRQPYQSSFEG